MKWEYAIGLVTIDTLKNIITVKLISGPHAERSTSFRQLALDDWELVNVLDVKGNQFAYFKRACDEMARGA